MNLDKLFNTKLTENGDLAYKSTGDNLLDILFLSEYYQKHLNEVHIGTSEEEKLFSMFIRDPRFGLGRRDLGRELMKQSLVSIEDIVKAGRYDDLFFSGIKQTDVYDFLYKECAKGNELAKKWMPRYSSKNLMLARKIAKYFFMNKQQYGHFIKANTTEQHLSRKDYDAIEFEKIPSLAMLKYALAFSRKPELASRYARYLEDVRSGKKDLKVSTTTVYDIYKNADKIDADLFFDKIEKISGSWIPIVDTSGSMTLNDAMGKALSIGHYLAKCSTYCPNKVITFSSHPELITLGDSSKTNRHFGYWAPSIFESAKDTQYIKEIKSMYTEDCSNTNFGAVMDILSGLDEQPEYLIVLSDMEFDAGSSMSKNRTMQLFKDKGFNTKIIWWNLNARNKTCPETDEYGNIFISGYNPLLLKFLQVGFDGKQFLNVLLKEYKEYLDK